MQKFSYPHTLFLSLKLLQNKVFLKDNLDDPGAKGIWEWPWTSGTHGPANASGERQALGVMGIPTDPAIAGALVTETATTEVNQKQVDGAVNQRAIPRVGLYLHGTSSRTQVLLGERDRGSIWEGKYRPDAEFKFLLDWALTSPTPPKKTCVTLKETIWNVNRWWDLLLTINVFFCPHWGWEFQSKVRTVENYRSSFSCKI